MAEKTSGSEQKLQADISTADLANMLDSMRKEFVGQRTAFETKIAELENQIASLQPTRPAPAKTEPTQPTSRRRVLKKLVVGAAGAAALGIAASSTIQPALAATDNDTLSFNGNGGTAGSNSASGNTFINATTTPLSDGYPILTLNNSTAPTNINTAPGQEPIGLYAQSTNSFAIYGNVPGAGTTPTAIIGISGTDPSTLTNGTFFAGEYGGIVGASDQNKGVVGLTTAKSAVEGLSLNGPGVRGVTNASIGGQFGVNPTNGDPTQGAALMIGPRKAVNAFPNNNAFSHSAGEMHVDKYGRLWLCQAGYRPGSGLEPTTVSSDIFDQGLLNQAGPNGPAAASWVQIPGVVYRVYSPPATDLGYYTSGQTWLNTKTGETFMSSGNNNTNGTMMDRDGNALPTQLTWTQTSTPFHFLSKPVRYVNTRNNLGGTRFADGDTKTFLIAGATPVVNSTQVYVPVNAVGILGNITIVNPNIPGSSTINLKDVNNLPVSTIAITAASGYATIWTGDSSQGNRPAISNVSYFVGGQVTGNFFATRLAIAATGEANVGSINVYCLRGADVIIDVFGYFGPNLPANA